MKGLKLVFYKNTKADLIIKVTALLIALVIFVIGIVLRKLDFYDDGSSEGAAALKAVISIDNEEKYSLPLDENTTFTVSSKYGINEVVIEDGKVSVTEADCPDKLCVKQGKKDKAGDTIICLPHRMIVTIEPDTV